MMRAVGLLMAVASVMSVSCRRQEDPVTYRYQLDEYYECMNKRETLFQRLQRLPFQSAVGLRDSSIVLTCFDWSVTDTLSSFDVGNATRYTCSLSPEMQLELEDEEKHDQRRMTWQHLNKTIGAKWRNVAVMGAGLVGRLERFVRPPDNLANERLDLQLSKLTRYHSGWYRCVAQKRPAATIGNVYHLDVVSDLSVVLDIPGIVSSSMMPDATELATFGVTVVNEWTAWSDCNRCGVVHAERRRRSNCFVQQSSNTSSNVPMLKLFDRLPCESSLLPLDVRKALGSRPTVEAVDICQVPCSQKPKTRVIKEFDSSGVEQVRDVLPPGEFSSLEGLPPLPPPIDRRAHRVTEGDPFVLDCPRLHPGSKFWRRDDITLTVAYLFHHNGTRVFVDADFRLRFLRLEFEDSALYSCWSWDRKLLSTADVRVERLNKTEEMIAYARMVIGFATLLLLFLLVATKIASTKGHSQAAVHESAKKMEQRDRSHASTSSSDQ